MEIIKLLREIGKAKRELGEEEMRHPDADDLFEYRRQDREDKGIAHLEERRRREPPIGDPCEACDGAGKVVITTGPCPDCGFEQQECSRCQGTGVC